MSKRTYSRRNMSMKPDDEDQAGAEGNKRQRKADHPSILSDVRMPWNTTNKKRAKRPFSGPVSICEEEAEVDNEETSRTERLFGQGLRRGDKRGGSDTRPLTALDKLLEPVIRNNGTPLLYRGRLKDFVAEQKKRREKKSLQTQEDSAQCHRKENKMDAKSPEPQPPVQEVKNGAMTDDSSGPTQRMLAEPPSAPGRSTAMGDHNMYHGFARHNTPQQPFECESPRHPQQPLNSQPPLVSTQKQPYIPRSNEVIPLLLPKRNIVNRRMDAESNEAKLWDINQTQSPLLRLPEPIRSRIFEHVFNEGRTIHIGLDAFISDKDRKENPHWKPGYWRKTYAGYLYPKSEDEYPTWAKIPTLFLNGVCRQMYHETRLLPYMYSILSFDSSLAMNALLLLDKRLAHAHHEIQSIVVGGGLSEALPRRNVLKYLDGLVMVFRRVHWGIEYYHVVRGKGGPRLVETMV